MPAPALKKLAAKAEVSMADAEHAWDKAKEIVRTQYKKSESDSAFWGLTMGITKKILGIKESQTFKQFLQQ